MRRAVVATVTVLSLAGCGADRIGAGPAPDPEPLQKAAMATARTAIPTAASALGGALVFAYGVLAECNLDAGKAAFAVVAHYEGDLSITTDDEADTVLATSLAPSGFGPGQAPTESVLTDGTDHVRVDPAVTLGAGAPPPGAPLTGYTITVHSKCVTMSDKQYAGLVRKLGRVEIDTSGW